MANSLAFMPSDPLQRVTWRDKEQAYYREYRRTHRDRLNSLARARYLRHKEKHHEKYLRNRTKWLEEAKKRHFLIHYGMTIDRLNELKNSQSGLCAICKRPRRLFVDHNHKSGQVRGMLCSPCNLLVGILENIPNVVQSAVEYISEATVKTHG